MKQKLRKPVCCLYLQHTNTANANFTELALAVLY